MNYIVQKKNFNFNINYMEYDVDGLVIYPKIKGEKYITVSKAKFYSEDIIKRISITRFDKHFGSLVRVVFTYLNASDDEASTGDYMILLDEVAHMKAKLEIEFKRFMDNEIYRAYMDKLYFLDYNLKARLSRANLMEQIQNQIMSGGIRR